MNDNFAFLPDKPTFTLQELARALGVNCSTTWRWALRGVRGRRLRTLVIGGRRRVTLENAKLFLHLLNEPLAPIPDPRGQRRQEYVELQLERRGL